MYLLIAINYPFDIFVLYLIPIRLNQILVDRDKTSLNK